MTNPDVARDATPIPWHVVLDPFGEARRPPGRRPGEPLPNAPETFSAPRSSLGEDNYAIERNQAGFPFRGNQ